MASSCREASSATHPPATTAPPPPTASRSNFGNGASSVSELRVCRKEGNFAKWKAEKTEIWEILKELKKGM